MALRYIGDVRIVLSYVGQQDGDRARYDCRLKTEPKDGEAAVLWRCSVVTPPGGPRSRDPQRALAVDSPEAYDEIAETALTFATATSDEDGDGPCPELACAFEEASYSAWSGKTLAVRRSRSQ